MWSPYSCGDGKEQQQVLKGTSWWALFRTFTPTLLIAEFLGLATVLAMVVDVMVHLIGAIAAAPHLADAGAGMLRMGALYLEM